MLVYLSLHFNFSFRFSRRPAGGEKNLMGEKEILRFFCLLEAAAEKISDIEELLVPVGKTERQAGRGGRKILSRSEL